MDCYLSKENKHGIMGDQEIEDDLDAISSSSSLSFTSDSIGGSSSDLLEDTTSSSSSASASSDQLNTSNGPLFEMSSLMQQLPIKRGLSKHYQGKSQSFTSLANVQCLDDLVKAENPYNKKLKSCKSYGGLALESHKAGSSPPMKTTSTKKSSKKCVFYSLDAKKSSNSLLYNKPPIPSQRSNSFCNHTPMFA